MNNIEYIKRCRLLKSNRQFAALEYKQVQESFIYWLEHYVFTLDTHDAEHPFKRFPVYDYIRHISEQIGKSQIFLIPKSRQIMISWFFCAWALYQVLYKTGKEIAFLSKRKEDADSMLLERMRIIYDRLPFELIPKLSNGKTAIKVFRGGAGKNARILNELLSSQVIAYPAGEEKVRSRTFYAIIMDEMAFIDKAEETVTAALPTVKGGGMIVGVSTANKDSFFLEMIELALGEFFLGMPEHTKKQILTWKGVCELSKIDDKFYTPQRGMVYFHSNAHNIDLMWVHYTANEDRRSFEWIENERKGYRESAWEQEMEINFNVVIGDQVFGDHPTAEEIVPEFEIPQGWIKIRALDPGGTRSQTACLWVAIDPQTLTWFCYREYYRTFLSVDVNKRHMLEMSLTDIPEGCFNTNSSYAYSIIDPQATSRDQNRGGLLYSVQHLYAEPMSVNIDGTIYDAGMYFMPGKRKPVHAIQRARTMFANGKIKIFDTCKNLINELRVYVDKNGKIEKGLKPNCPNDHLIDCLLFLLQALPMVQREPEPKRPTIGYINNILMKRSQKGDLFLGSEF